MYQHAKDQNKKRMKSYDRLVNLLYGYYPTRGLWQTSIFFIESFFLLLLVGIKARR
jgi:hypothetical protein